jgi:hypothetical protein
MDAANTISGLIRKRQELLQAFEAAQDKMRQLVTDLDAVDATIRLFEPEMDLNAVRVRPTPRRYQVSRGDNSKLILSLLREAGGPLSHRELTVKVMEHRGLNLADKELAQTIRCRVGASLRGLRSRGTLASGTGRGSGMKWWVA